MRIHFTQHEISFSIELDDNYLQAKNISARQKNKHRDDSSQTKLLWHFVYFIAFTYHTMHTFTDTPICA